MEIKFGNCFDCAYGRFYHNSYQAGWKCNHPRHEEDYVKPLLSMDEAAQGCPQCHMPRRD